MNEWVVREFFEMQGYLVNQPRKYDMSARPKKAEEEVDLVVYHPGIAAHRVPDHMVWMPSDLKQIAWAVVAVRGWHTERFYPSTFEQTPDILRFVEPRPVRAAQKMLGSETLAKVLCLPRLPASGELRRKTIEVLKEKGVDGVISFETMLAELVVRVEINRNYEKSDPLQMIRLLKNYGLLKDAQFELFDKRPRQ